ncbi:hypothetical protein CMV_028551 [Castanea mollissima]|uniref:Disease resistance N-terminal domain-containing protein n=1 Tax=Castanea mollissima TaxID=60419 RepID=A0A8J4Q4R9_9ROSI|nr:hypothetical protein CMV_028551 [Castanea mollissima]
MTALVSVIAVDVIKKLRSLAYQEISLAWGIASDLKKLEDTMSTIQAVLLDAEEKQAENHQLKVWLERLKAVFHDAVDVVDEFECEDLRRQVVKTYGSTGRKVCRFFSFSNPLAFGCPRLLRFPEGIQRLTALHRLEFTYCENLTSLPRGMKHLTALEVLGIWDCEKLILMEGDDYPMRLRRLTIGFLPKLVSLPQGLIPSANTLQFLAIYHCGNLEKLPQRLPNLSSLPKLDIMNCPKLLSLPKRMDRRLVLKD